MQRYDPRYTHFGHPEPDANGDYVLYEEAQAEIYALHKECDRLTALLEKPKVLETHEVTEPGFYWHHKDPSEEWGIADVTESWPIGTFDMMPNGMYWNVDLEGQFVGPLKQPEV